MFQVQKIEYVSMPLHHYSVQHFYIWEQCATFCDGEDILRRPLNELEIEFEFFNILQKLNKKEKILTTISKFGIDCHILDDFEVKFELKNGIRPFL